MSWNIDDVRNALADHGIDAIAASKDGLFYSSDKKDVDPDVTENCNMYAFYAYCDSDRVKVLLITTSLGSKDYVSQVESKFTELTKTLVKNTTGHRLSDDFLPQNGYEEKLGMFTLSVERETEEHSNSLRGLLYETGSFKDVKALINKADYSTFYN